LAAASAPRTESTGWSTPLSTPRWIAIPTKANRTDLEAELDVYRSIKRRPAIEAVLGQDLTVPKHDHGTQAR
jgi:hypothetical protein